MALGAIISEMDFVSKVSQKHAGQDMKSKPGRTVYVVGGKRSEL